MNSAHTPVTRRIVIVGTGGHAREIHELIEDINAAGPAAWEIMGWLDSNAAAHGTTVHDLPVLGDVDWLQANPDVYVTVAIGAPPVRRRVVERIRAVGHTRFATLIHPTALIGRRVEIGEGTVICAGVITSTDYRLGQHVLLNRMATVAHDDDLHDFVTIAPSAVISGNVTIGEGTDLGTNATVNQGVEIGAWTIVGSGAVVTKSLPANCTAVGAPAKPIKERPEGWHL
ncbi:acetyltransferase [Deinococcus xianganensis]|uniref:Acetyltransferase n=1 Tax=Deinococcus xianganensis TaxID=1507289 RepID=A0A6I4YE31_9DEIO|nr:acetyltransferase [Deinococcus xianganensis]MXV18134.1 acetyltransferase [Deinococcus xianganensis]